MDDRTSPIGLIGLIAITSAFTYGFHQLGGIEGLAVDWSNPLDWASSSATEDVISATLRLIGLGVGYWVLATTAIYVATGIGKRVRRPRWVTIVTLPGVRRIVDRTLAASLAVTIVTTPLGPAFASEPPPAPAVVVESTDGIPVPHVRLAPTSVPTTEPVPAHQQTDIHSIVPLAPLPTPTAQATAAPVPATRTTEVVGATHVVEIGDSLWRIAARHLTIVNGEDTASAEVVVYWRRVIEANEPTLRSGDPNLIFPGELISLPAIETAP